MYPPRGTSPRACAHGKSPLPLAQPAARVAAGCRAPPRANEVSSQVDLSAIQILEPVTRPRSAEPLKLVLARNGRPYFAKFFVDRRDRPVASRARPGPPGARARRPSDPGEGEASNAPGPVPAGPWRRARPAGQGRVARWRKTAAGRCRKFPTILKEKSCCEGGYARARASART